MTELEQQADELEALASIYDGELCFKQVNNTTFQYKYGEEESGKSFMIEITWQAEYPNELPKISLDLYYNRSISDSLKTKIVDILKAEGENWIGCGMTYTLFECVKEHLDELTNEIEQELKNASAAATENFKALQLAPVLKTTPSEAPAKKEQLTKSQKRRLWERTDNKGNRARGWDWVDIIRHLSQTGHSRDEPLLTNAQNVTIAQTPMN